MSSLVFRITGDTSAFKAAMGEVSGSLDAAGRKSDDLSNKLGSLGTKLSIGITAPVIALGVSVVKTATEMDSLKRGLTAVAGSSEEAERQLKRLQEVAKLPGLGFKDAVEGSIRLQAAGFNAQLAERSLKAFGNALATVGKGKAELDGVTLALSQIASKGKISAEEINQLAERVPQIRQAMIAAFGTADTEVLQKAGIKAEEFVTRVVAQLEKLEQVTGGPKNAFENFSDAVQKSADRIGSKLLPELEKVLPKLEKLAIFAADAVDEFTKLPGPIQDAGVAIGVLVLAAGPVSKLASAFIGLRAAILGVTTVSAAAGIARGAAAGADIFSTKTVEAMHRLAPAATAAAGGISAVGLAAGAAGGAAVAGFLNFLNTSPTALQNQKKASDEASDGMKRLNERFQTGGMMGEWLRGIKSAGGGMDGLKESTRDVTKELAAGSQAMNKITVDSVAGADAMGALSKHSLLYVEIQERVKSAVGKVKDVMYEYITAGSIYGKQIEMQRAPLTELAIAADDYRLALAKTRFELEAMGKMPPLQMATPTQPTRQGTVFETDDILRRSGAVSSRESRSRIDQLEADLARVRQLNEEGKATGNDVIAVQQALNEEYKKQGQVATISAKAQKAAIQQVSLVITDLSRGITDVIFKGGKFGDMMKNIALDVAKSITRILIEGAIKDLGKSLIGLQTTSTNVFSGIAKMMGGLFSGAASGASQALGGAVFQGGTGAIMSAVNGAPLAAGIFSNMTKTGVPGVTAVGMENPLGGLPGFGGGGGAAGSASKVAGSSISAIAGIVTGAASAISGIVGNFQMKGMNKTLDLIEKSTRYAEAYQLSILEKTNSFLPKLADIHDRLIEFRQLGIKLEAGGSLTIAGAGAGGDSYYFDFSGANLAGATPQSFEAALMAAVTKMKQKGLTK